MKDEKVIEQIKDLKNRFKDSVKISEYVEFNMSETLNRIHATMNDKFISGEYDALGRKKPYFNISNAAANVWYRATDIDRKDIKIIAEHKTEYINALLATHHLRKYMRKSSFGLFLNNWGLTLARYGSAVVKILDDNNEFLSFRVVPWSSIIVDPIDFNASPQVEIFYMTKEQLKKEAKARGYDLNVINNLQDGSTRKDLKDKEKSDKKGFYRLYETHGVFDGKQMMYVFVEDGGEFKLIFKAEEKFNPYQITHLIPEDGRTLSKGAIERLFEPQWGVNYSMKQIKDQLDLANKIIFQTADSNLFGRNVLTNIETGDIILHAPNMPITQLNNSTHDIGANNSWTATWKSLRDELAHISEAMLGKMPKSGTPWRSTEAILQESYSLFDIMIEQKGLYIEEWLRKFVIPHIKKNHLNNSKEIAVVLDDHDLQRIDKAFIKRQAISYYNSKVAKAIITDDFTDVPQSPQEAEMQIEKMYKEANTGNIRYFIPDDKNSQKTWAEQFKNMEWELEIDISGEQRNRSEVLSTLNTTLQVIANPNFAQNKYAQKIVAKILETTGAMSSLELQSLDTLADATIDNQNKIQDNVDVIS